MHSSAHRLLAVVATAVLLAAGCGGDDDGGGGERLTREEFVTQGNAICAAGNERLDAMFEELFPTEEDFADPDKQEEAKDNFVEDIQGQIDDVGELEPPEDMEADVEEFLDTAQEALDQVEEMSAEEFFGLEEDPFAEVSEQAEALGLTECADDGADEGEG